MKYNRVLLKVSGEALAGEQKLGINYDKVEEIAAQIGEVAKAGIELGIVVGGGNLMRGAEAEKSGMNRAQADYMGMLGTIMNALALQNALEQLGHDTRVMTSIAIQEVAEPYIYRKAMRHLEKDRIIIFGGGTGAPFFSTDTASSLKACELNADAILMAKNGVDGVYDSDPKMNPDAKMFDELSLKQIVSDNLQIMDMTAATMALDNNIDIVVFDMNKPGNILKAATGEKIGTLIYSGEKNE
jgi:uridylate kinase